MRRTVIALTSALLLSLAPVAPATSAPVPVKPGAYAGGTIGGEGFEDIALRVAHALEKMGVVSAPSPRGI